MADIPFPLTGTDIETLKGQIWELIRQVYEEKIGGADLGDVFSLMGDVLTLKLGDDSGLTKEDNELSIEINSSGGLQLVSNGIAIKIISTGGLQVSTSGLGIKLDGTSLVLGGNGLKINPGSGGYVIIDAITEGNIIIDSTHAFYLGDPNTNGSWRTIRSGDDLHFQRREVGSWQTKGIIYATPP